MKLIKPSVQFFGAVPTDYESSLKFIEMAGRTCYKSEDKITDDSAEKFVKKLINNRHLAMIEHSNFVAKLCNFNNFANNYDWLPFMPGKYLNIICRNNNLYIGGNLTAWYNRELEIGANLIFKPFYKTFVSFFYSKETISNKLQMIKGTPNFEVCPFNEIPPELHRYSAKFICNRAVSHELVRHRPPSYAQESQRYVNYSGKDMEFIEPAKYDLWSAYAKEHFSMTCSDAEVSYIALINEGLSPQQARAILPNATKTEIICTCDAQEWQHIKDLRTSSAADPEMQRVMNMMPWEEFL